MHVLQQRSLHNIRHNYSQDIPNSSFIFQPHLIYILMISLQAFTIEEAEIPNIWRSSAGGPGMVQVRYNYTIQLFPHFT